MTTPFLGDKNQIKEAIARIPGQKASMAVTTQHDVAISQALAIADGDESAIEIVAARDCPSAQRQFKQYTICKEEIRGDAVVLAEQTRQAGNLTLGGLRDLLTSLKTVDGPKTLIYVSQGFFVDRGRGDDTGRIIDLANLAASARTSVYALRMEETPDLSRSRMQAISIEDAMTQRYGLETLSGAAGGTLFNLVGTGGAVFDRLGVRAVRLLPARGRGGRARSRRQAASRPCRRRAAERHDPDATDDADGHRAVRSRCRPISAASRDRRAQLAAARVGPAHSCRGRVRIPRTRTAKVRLLIHAEIGSGYTGPQRLPLAYYVFDKDGRPSTAR